MIMHVYVQSIINTGNGVVVRATNGGEHGPPLVEWKINSEDVPYTNIGTAYKIEINRVLY